MITASGEQGESAVALDAGADDFIVRSSITPSCSRACARRRGSSATMMSSSATRPACAAAGLRWPTWERPTCSCWKTHRGEVVVLVCGLDGFAAFAETAPRTWWRCWPRYDGAVGGLIDDAAPTLSRLAGDVVTVVLNDCCWSMTRHGSAVTLALALRDRVWELGERWTRLGFSLSPASAWPSERPPSAGSAPTGAGKYAQVGPAPQLAERLAEAATAAEILVSHGWKRP